MAGFLYYVLTTAPNKVVLRDMGFPFAADASLPGCGVMGGPDGKAGAVFTLSPSVHKDGRQPVVGYYPDKQQWRKCPGWWLGWETDSPPTPADVQSRAIPFGHVVTLRGGGKFLVPAAKQWNEKPGIPTVLGMDEDGGIAHVVVPEYRRLWELAERIWATAYVAGNNDDMSEEDAIEAVVLALSINYRLSKYEVLHAGLFSTDEFTTCRQAIVDWPTMQVVLEWWDQENKKKQLTEGGGNHSASTKSGSGQEVCGTVIDQP